MWIGFWAFAALALGGPAWAAPLALGSVYDCGPGKTTFRLVSCGQDGNCDLFYLNAYSPNGGSHIATARSTLDAMIQSGCHVKGQPVTSAPAAAAATAPTHAQAPAAIAPPAASCPAEDHADPGTREGIFKGLIRARYEKAPQDRKQGDPIVTVRFSRFEIGSARRYRLPHDGYQSEDGPGGDGHTRVYPVRAEYVVCSDYPGYPPTGYRGEVQRYDNANTFTCFQNAFNFKGQWQCNLGQGHSGPTQYLKK